MWVSPEVILGAEVRALLGTSFGLSQHPAIGQDEI